MGGTIRQTSLLSLICSNIKEGKWNALEARRNKKSSAIGAPGPFPLGSGRSSDRLLVGGRSFGCQATAGKLMLSFVDVEIRLTNLQLSLQGPCRVLFRIRFFLLLFFLWLNRVIVNCTTD